MKHLETIESNRATSEGVLEDSLRLRMQTVPVGVGVTWATVAALAAWVTTTWSSPHRGLIAAMLGVAAASAAIIALLPRERIVRSRWREPFFLTWSMAYVVFITAVAAADGGDRSPATFVYFLTLAFAALSYPFWLVVAISVSSLAGFVGLAVLYPTGTTITTLSPASVWVFATCLALVGVMCALQARINAQHSVRLGRLSRSDALTGCLNRFGLSERLERELQRAGGTGAVGVVLLDLVGFKSVNDTFGHPAGDELLVWVARAVGQLLRPGDSVGRLGGDEFAVILPGADRATTDEVAERVRAALAERVQASPGAASSPADGSDAATLVRVADERLYAARRRSPTATPVSSAD